MFCVKCLFFLLIFVNYKLFVMWQCHDDGLINPFLKIRRHDDADAGVVCFTKLLKIAAI